MVVVMMAERFHCERTGLWLTARCTQNFSLVFFFSTKTNANVKHSGEGVDARTETSRLAGFGLINNFPDSTRIELRRVPRAHVHLE
jgi:hypothetical protein